MTARAQPDKTPRTRSRYSNATIAKVGDVYYDPSYGKTYTSTDDFENKAVVGFMKTPLILSDGKYGFRQNPGDKADLTFTESPYP